MIDSKATGLTAPPPASAAPLIAEGLYSYIVGGSERLAASLALAFRDRGYRVLAFAVYVAEGPILEELRASGIECVDCAATSHPRLLRRVTYPLALAAHLRRHGASVLHLHHATSMVAVGPAARLAGARVVLTEHDLAALATRPRYLAQSRRALRGADMVTVVHEDMLGFFRERLAVPSNRLRYIANGIPEHKADAEARARVRARLGIADGVFTFAFVGRLAPVKDVPTLLRAYDHVRRTSRQPTALLLIGDGAERPSLERLAGELGLSEAVRFLGVTRNVSECLNAADAFVMTSTTEGQPMALLEAMGAGLPCVATRVGGIPEMLDGGCGLLVPPGDPPAIAAGLLELLSNPELRASLAAAARRRVAMRHSFEKMVTDYLAAFGLPPHWPAPQEGRT